MNKSKYLETINDFYENKDHKKLFNELVKLIGDIDLNCNIAKISIENCYTKPIIIDSEKSGFDAKDIRHPIVEKIQSEIEYRFCTDIQL